MSRKKTEDQGKVLSRPIIIRLTEGDFQRLEEVRKQSDLRTIGEVARHILSDRKIRLFYHDVSMNGPMEELAAIRKELKAIGVNINQQTHRFHASGSEAERAFYAAKTATLYQTVGNEVDRLLVIVSQLAKKWLQRS